MVNDLDIAEYGQFGTHAVESAIVTTGHPLELSQRQTSPDGAAVMGE